MSNESLVAWDAEHLWHPYGAFPPSTAPLLVESARGARLRLADGRELVDAMSSWWAAIHGYRHPRLDAALADQAGRMSHVMFGGLTHAPAVRLGQALTALAPGGLDRVFFADSGSVAVEVAVKMALHAQRGRGRPERRRLLTWRGGYHGDTLHPMSVCDPEGGMHQLWRGVLPSQVFAEAPGPEHDPAWSQRFDDLLAAHADETAAVIIEPVVQGAGGMRFHDPRTVADVAASCRRHGVLLIADEIATGFGRTGTLWACDAAGVVPDILCVGKALTGGYLTLAAVLTDAALAEDVGRGEGLMHGPTFMANPLATAVAAASVELIAEGGWRRDVPRLEAGLRRGLAPLADHPAVADVRVLGAIGVVECVDPVDMTRATDAAVAAGAWVRPFGRLVYAMPPYVSTDAEIETVCAAITAAVEEGAPRG